MSAGGSELTVCEMNHTGEERGGAEPLMEGVDVGERRAFYVFNV